MTNHSISLFHQSWTAPKQEYTDEQNEDACRIESIQQDDGSQTLLMVVSDGASGAVYSRLWAQALVEATQPDWPTLSDEELDSQLQQVRQAFKPLDSVAEVPWFVKTKMLTEGSQATLLVATVASAENPDSVEVRALSVGDSCLLLFTRCDLRVHSFPVGASNDFGVNPSLVGTLKRPLEYRRLPPTLMRPGDFLLVCTDAIGKWIMQCLESGASDLFFEALLELLKSDADELNPPVGDSSRQAFAPPGTGDTVPDADSIGAPAPGSPHKSGGRLERLLQWFQWRHPRSDQTPDLPETAKTVTTFSEGASRQETPLEGEGSEAETPEPAATGPDSTQSDSAAHLKFQRFIETYRRPEGKPRMRDDDSTLVLCLPVRGGGDKQPQEAVVVIRNYQAAGAGRELLIQLMNSRLPHPTSN